MAHGRLTALLSPMTALLIAAAAGSAAADPESAGPALDLSSLDREIVAEGAEPKEWRVFVWPGYGISLWDGSITEPYVAPRLEGTGAVLASGRLTLRLEGEPCTVAGDRYQMTASLTVANGPAWRGCAFVPWSHDVLALWPAIEACLASAAGNMRAQHLSVIYAAAETGGGSFVRLRAMALNQDEDKELDCHVAVGAAPALGPADMAVHEAGIGRAILVPARENPGWGDEVECFKPEELRTPDGRLLGWWNDPYGC